MSDIVGVVYYHVYRFGLEELSVYIESGYSSRPVAGDGGVERGRGVLGSGALRPEADRLGSDPCWIPGAVSGHEHSGSLF